MFGQRGHEVLAVVVEGGSFLGVFVCGIDDGGVKLASGCSAGSALCIDGNDHWRHVRGRGACLRFGISSCDATSLERVAVMLN